MTLFNKIHVGCVTVRFVGTGRPHHEGSNILYVVQVNVDQGKGNVTQQANV